MPISRLFDYRLPGTADADLAGRRVRVPFGKRHRVGLVMAVAADSEIGADKLKPVDAILDPAPVLGEDDRWLLRFTADYYHHPIGEVCAAALPALLRQGRELHPQAEYFATTATADSVDLDQLARRAPRQAELLQLLADAGGNGLDVDTLAELMPGWRRIASALRSRGFVESFTARVDDPPAGQPTIASGPELNADQQAAFDAIEAGDGHGCFVLDGVTGSGKTEVYLRLIETCLAAGRQALVLVPEIGLTPQLVGRFRERFGIEPAVLHSGLTDLSRLTGWRRARNGDAALVVGTRSAVFVPLARPGLVIVDEEHDPSLKQQEGLRYSARDLAIARASRAGIPVVLGSATPSLDVLQHCRRGLYRRLSLPERAGGARQPHIRVVDIAAAAAGDGLGETLAAQIAVHRDAGGQVLLFLNRRGFAPTLLCVACGAVAECRRCDSRMTVHAGDQYLRCHHCGAARPLDTRCGDCGDLMRPLGEGTERLEDAVRRRFPDTEVRRIDSDSMQASGAIDAALAEAASGDTEILVGTQMLSKGHHFPRLTLVGIVNADQGLFGTDFRAAERLAQSIVQVAGRAGREDRPGEVLIQTAYPRHPFWARLIAAGYAGVADDALAEREATGWPPFSRLALLRASATRHRDAVALLTRAREIALASAAEKLRVFGPVDAPMARRAGRYRVQLLLQSTDRRELHRVLGVLRARLEADRLARRARWSVDVDPIELF